MRLFQKKREAVLDEFNYKSKIQGEYFDTKAAIKALSFDQSDFNALSLSYIIDYQDDFFFFYFPCKYFFIVFQLSYVIDLIDRNLFCRCSFNLDFRLYI